MPSLFSVVVLPFERPLQANDIVYNSANDTIYASIPGIAGATGNSIRLFPAHCAVRRKICNAKSSNA